MKFVKHIIILKIIIVFIALISACKKIVEVIPPSTRIAAGNVYTSDATAIAVLNGIYSQISSTNYEGSPSLPTISMWTGLSADEFALYSGANANQSAYYRNNLTTNVAGYEIWIDIYSRLYACNAAIEGISNSTTLTSGVKKQLMGEAKFMRAFFYFYLVNLYGAPPPGHKYGLYR